MRERTAGRRLRAGLAVVLFLFLSLTVCMQSAAASSSQVRVTVWGRLTDQTGEPISEETVHFSFYTSPKKADTEKGTTTDRDGIFRLQVDVPQTVYWNSGRPTVELQARMFLEGHARVIRYQPGSPQRMSDSGSYEGWTEQGTYSSDAIPVFHSLRMSTILGMGGDFQDMSVTLGSPEAPCTFQVGTSFAVTEHYVGQKGEALKPPRTTTGYTPGEGFQGWPPPAVEKDGIAYHYEGYQKDGEPYLLAGQPEGIVTADVTYQYVYRRSESEKPGGSGGGGLPGGEEKPEPPQPPEPEPPEEEHPPGEEPPPEEGGSGGLDPIPWEPEPETPEPETPEPWNPEPEPPQTGEPENGGQSGEGQGRAALTEEQRAALRNITFVKWSYRQDAAPGEEITYGFAGFENQFPYPLKEFTIVDEPDPGLDLVSIQLPAFSGGAGVDYDVIYSTNQRRELSLARGCPADAAQNLKPPELNEGEHITELYIKLAEAPPGFGKNDEFQITFRIWDDPPEEILQNRAFLYYLEQEQLVSLQSDGRQASVEVGKSQQSGSEQLETKAEKMREDTMIHGGRKSLSSAFGILLLILALVMGSFTAAEMRKKKRKT